MFKKYPTASHSEVDRREATNSPPRDFLDVLVKSSFSAMAVTAVGTLVAGGHGGDVCGGGLRRVLHRAHDAQPTGERCGVGRVRGGFMRAIFRRFFHAFGAAAKSDAQYAVHLGDYIDKHGPDLDKDERPKYGNIIIPGGCITTPPNDIVSMNDYRSRHALNKLDLNLQAPHAAHAGHPHQRP